MTSSSTRRSVLWLALMLGLWPVVFLETASAQLVDLDAGSEEDAGSGEPLADSEQAPPPLAAERVVVLPPAAPPPRIAPVVDAPARTQAEAPIASAERPAVLLKTILGLLALITLAYVGGHDRVLAFERKLGIAQVITSGFPFVLLGWTTRTPALGVLTDELLTQLSPLLRLGLGCIGFAAGFRFATRLPTGVPALRVATAVTMVPFSLVALSCGSLLLLMTGGISSDALQDPVFLRDAMVLGTAGAVTAQTSIAIFRADDSNGVIGRVLGVEELVGIFGLAVVAAYFRPAVGVTWQLPGTAWLLLTLGLGASLGLISYLVLRRPQQRPEFVLLALGLIGFSAGTAGYLRLSPIVIAFVAGTSLALLPTVARARLHEALTRLERPIYLLSLIVIGALWQISDWRGWVLAPVFTVSRLLGKRLGLDLGLRAANVPLDTDQKLALTIAPMGRLAIAIVVNAQLLYPGGSISPIVAAVIVGGMLTEIVVQLASRRTAATTATTARSIS